MSDHTHISADQDQVESEKSMESLNTSLQSWGFRSDVNALNDFARDRKKGSRTAANLLLAIHEGKSVEVDTFDLGSMDSEHRTAALQMIEFCADPSTRPVSGLSGILANDYIVELISYA